MRTTARISLLLVAAFALSALWLFREDSVTTDSLTDSTKSDSPLSQSSDRIEPPLTTAPEASTAEGKFDVHTNGVVVDPLGLLSGGATVEAWTPDENVEAERRCRSHLPALKARAVTDSQGAFALEWSEEEQYCVRAKHQEWSNSEPLLVSTGENAEDSLRLILQRPLQLRGRVVDSSGATVTGAKLALARRDGPATAEDIHASVDAAGHFIFGRLDPGEYELKSADSRHAISQPKEIVLRAQSIDDLLVRADAVTAITGRVLDPKSKPLANVRIFAQSAYDKELSLGSTLSREDGTFTLHSEPRSEAARIAQRMSLGGVVDRSGNETRETNARSGAMCVGFEHPSLQTSPIDIVDAESARDVGVVYMRAATILSGLILERDRPVAARLRFQPLPTQMSRLTQGACAELPITREVQTKHDGTFAVQLAAGHYQVDVIPTDAPPRSIEVQIAANQREIRLAIQ